MTLFIRLWLIAFFLIIRQTLKFIHVLMVYCFQYIIDHFHLIIRQTNLCQENSIKFPYRPQIYEKENSIKLPKKIVLFCSI